MNSMIRRQTSQQAIGLSLVLILLTLLISPAVFAQEKSVVVERRDGSYTIATDGTVQAIETWQVRFRGGPFPSDTEWEIRATFPHGVIASALPAWQAADDARQARIPALNIATLALALLSGLGGSVGLYLFWYRRGRDAPARAAPAYLTAPPDDLLFE